MRRRRWNSCRITYAASTWRMLNYLKTTMIVWAVLSVLLSIVICRNFYASNVFLRDVVSCQSTNLSFLLAVFLILHIYFAANKLVLLLLLTLSILSSDAIDRLYIDFSLLGHLVLNMSSKNIIDWLYSWKCQQAPFFGILTLLVGSFDP